MLSGTFTALITPFKNGQLDEEGFIQNIRDQLKTEIEGLVLLGTTAESPTLTNIEQKRILEIGIKEAKNKAFVIAGTGTNCTRTTIEKTKWAQSLGADAALIVNPYYNKPTQEGLFKHFEALSNAVSIPLLAYNHPGRTAVHIEPETLMKIADLKHVIGVKEASSDFDYIQDILKKIKIKHPSFSILSGCDEHTLKMIKMGAQGVISVISNLVPKEMHELVNLALQGAFSQADLLHQKLKPFMEMACIETNPMAIKAALDFCQKPAGECRLPLCSLTEVNRLKLETFLNQWELAPLCKN